MGQLAPEEEMEEENEESAQENEETNEITDSEGQVNLMEQGAGASWKKKSPFPVNRKTQPPYPTMQKKPTCFCCGEDGHWQSKCPYIEAFVQGFRAQRRQPELSTDTSTGGPKPTSSGTPMGPQ